MREGNPPPSWMVFLAPNAGDLLCFDGEKWTVARRDWWNYPVPIPQESSRKWLRKWLRRFMALFVRHA